MVAPGRCSTSASGKTSSSVPAKKSFVAQPVRTSGWGPAGAARPSCRAVLSRATSAPQAVMADTGSSADMGLGAFAAWARQSGIQFEATQPANFDGLRGVAAKAPIKADELLMSVPRSAALTLGPKAKCPFQDFVTPTYWSSAPWFVKMGLKLLNERRRGSASPLAPYLASLPAAVDAPIFWTDGQLQMLQYPHLIQQVKQQREEWTALHGRLSAGLAPGAAPVTQADFFWALSLVRSRTFSGPYIGSTLADRLRTGALVATLGITNVTAFGADLQTTLTAVIGVMLFNILYEVILSGNLKQYALCPMIDLMNHSSTGTAELSYDYFADRYSVAAGRNYAVGEQVFVSYGAQSNDSLLQYYAFSEVDNPRDTYVMASLLQHLEALQPLPRERLDALNAAKLLPALQEAAVARTGFAPATLQALRFLLADGAAAGKGPAAFAAAGDAASERRLALALAHACSAELKALGTSLHDDAALLASAAPSASAAGGNVTSGSGASGGGKGFAGKPGARLDAREMTALQFRIEKKKVLQACLDAMKSA